MCIFILYCGSSIAASCLYISSYHAGYEWNDGIEEGIEKTLSGVCDLDKFYMDTKRNKSHEFAKKSALKAKSYIDKTNPDVIMACDDNASKYLIEPHYKDANRDFVFCGINWTAEEYGYPYSNATGMIEVAPIRPLLKVIKKMVKKVRQGVYFSADVLTEHKDFSRYKSQYAKKNVELTAVFVKTKEEWKAEFLKAQEADFIILNNNSGINDWDNEEMKKFVAEVKGTTLTVTNYDWMLSYAMLAMTKSAQEQGEWAGQVAKALLEGEKPSDIPVVANRRWNIFANAKLLDRAGYQLPSSIATKVVYKEM